MFVQSEATFWRNHRASPNCKVDMNNLTVETNDTFASLLELAANNDVEGVKRFIDQKTSGINEVGLWYTREKGSKRMILLHRTPLMVASTYGSIDVVKQIISFSDIDLNKPCGADKTTALHCAASGGSLNAIDVVKVLLEAGANPNLVDANGYRPIDVIVVPPKLDNSKRSSLKELLLTGVSINNSDLSPENGFPLSKFSPDHLKTDNIRYVPAKKEYPVDPYLPDIKNEIYSTDEFRIFSFKVRPCSRAYSHDWTECPFVHPGENARRRDPRKYHYSCVPCPDFRKGACRKGDLCEYAHGVFESWLHPAQYRTRICKDGTSCNRRVCFFAHRQEELRSLYSSPRSCSTNAIDFTSAMNLFPNSPSSSLSLSPLSPSANAFSNVGWCPPNVPALHLPGSNLSSSRLRSSLNARDFQANRLDDLFCDEPIISPTHNSALLNSFHHQKSMLSPVNTNFSPKSIECPSTQSPFVGSSSGPISPMSSRVSSLRENFWSLSSRDMGRRDDSWMNWGSASGKANQADLAVNDDDFGKLQKSSSFELKNDVEEPDLGWVHSLVKEDNQMLEGGGSSSEGSGSQPLDALDTMIGAWLEQMKFDELVA